MASVTQLRPAAAARAPAPRGGSTSALSSNDALTLEHVTRAFGALKAVDDVSFSVAAGQKYAVLPWPYKEALRMDEAMHPLTLFATGMYGKPLPNQNGAPLRLVVPWKYGFKGIKSIVKIRFTEAMPNTTWSDANPREYGFYANVNPAVDHPRWSQAKERRIGEFLKRNTLPFNGYADQVASLYAGMDLRKFY